MGLEIDQHILDVKKWSPTQGWFYVGDNTYRLFGRAPNEGLTEVLTDEILRKK